MSELKPCPFCGATPVIICEENTACWYIECECEAHGPPECTGDEAIAAWNTRAEPAGEPVADVATMMSLYASATECYLEASGHVSILEVAMERIAKGVHNGPRCTVIARDALAKLKNERQNQ